MLDLDHLTPAQYRARYEALQEAARARAATPAEAPPLTEIPFESLIKSESIPPGNYVALRLKRGTAIRISNPSGTPGAALFLWNADDISERYNAGDTVKLQWTTNLTTGRVLFSDMGRILASITGDTGAGHDSIIGPNSPAQTGAARNGRDNLRLAAAKLGLTRRDLGPALSLFSPVFTDEAGIFHWSGAPPAGATVELRAEMNLLMALSNTPHALSPQTTATGPLDYTIHHAPPLTTADFCRTFTAEAGRGFTNTEAFFTP
jgi:urea carboxylase-associated protein 2